jgi:hypothetical protein
MVRYEQKDLIASNVGVSASSSGRETLGADPFPTLQDSVAKIGLRPPR